MSDHWSSWLNWYSLIACFNWYLLIAWLLVSLFVMSLWHIILLQSLGLNIVCLPPSIYHWICVLHSTLFLRDTQFMEEHSLYWPSKLFTHFGNRCQWGRSFREFCGEVFRVFSLLWFWFLSICIPFSCIIGCCTAWWCITPCINSLESDCRQLPKWGRLKEHAVPPCLVLVIDDNLYGLMVVLSYIWRICP